MGHKSTSGQHTRLLQTILDQSSMVATGHITRAAVEQLAVCC
ncbi:MAG: hypothetical protein WCH85_11790 [Methanomicrobiales archaeon]